MVLPGDSLAAVKQTAARCTAEKRFDEPVRFVDFQRGMVVEDEQGSVLLPGEASPEAVEAAFDQAWEPSSILDFPKFPNHPG